MRSCRRAATKVRVFQWPCGTLATSLAPRGAHPPSGAMFVFVQVSSMKTRRSGLIGLESIIHCARRRAMSGRSRSLAMTVFFKTELLGMNKVPHRSIVDLEAAPGKFGHKAAQGELPVPDPLHEKDMVLAGNGLGFVAAHLERRHAARLLEPPNPIDHRAGSDAKPGRHPMPRQPAFQNRRDGTLAKVNR